MVKTRKFKTLEGRNGYIVGQRRNGKTADDISKEVGICKRQVKRISQAYRQNGPLSRKKGSSRPQVLNKVQKLRLLKTLENDYGRPMHIIVEDLKLPCNVQTAINYAKLHGFFYRKSQKKPYLTYEDHEARLMWARGYREYDFSSTIFVDESVFRVGEPCHGWARVGQPVFHESSNYAPFINVWASISAFGKLSITFYEGNLDQFRYQELLEDHLYAEANDLWGPKVWVMLQDGAPCHRAKNTKKAILEEAGDIIAWPAASPDLNPIENVWWLLKNKVYSRNPRTKADLEQFVMEEWENLDNNVVIPIAESMSNRVNMLIENEGSYIGY